MLLINCQDDLQIHITNALTPCVKRKLTHVVKTILTQPHMPAPFRVSHAHIACISPLVDALSGAVTEAAGSSPSGDSRITTCIKVDTINLTVALTSALTHALTNVVKKNLEAIVPTTEVIGDVAQVRECIKVNALNENPSSPTVNTDDLIVELKSALIPNGDPSGVEIDAERPEESDGGDTQENEPLLSSS